MGINGTHEGKRGHPTNQEQIDNKEKCKKAFDAGYPILYAAEKLGLNKNTVNAYYIELREIALENIDKNFINEQKHGRQMAMKKLQIAIDEVDALMQLVMNDNENKDYALYLKCIEVKTSFEQQMHQIETSPTIDVKVEDIIKEGNKDIEQIKSSSEQPK